MQTAAPTMTVGQPFFIAGMMNQRGHQTRQLAKKELLVGGEKGRNRFLESKFTGDM